MDRQPIISAKDVEITFSLRGKKLNAIRKCSLDLYDGETLAIVGESGSGKSTIGRSIIRLYDPTAGKITFDGQDISGRLTYAQNNTLRTQMQMIFQDPMASLNPRKKVEDIIGEGLDIHHLCKTQAERREKVEKILAKVGLAPEHAERYPHQFSGGQRQRIAIARAILKNPKILILDEATSALDTESEKIVQDALDKLMVGRTSFVIAHRLSTIKNADQILVLNHGVIEESGTHKELMEKKGLYYELYTMSQKNDREKNSD